MDIAVSLTAVAIKFVGGVGKVVIVTGDELVDVPFAFVAVRENEYDVLVLSPKTFNDKSG
jgi:hypothetical protein